MPKTYSPIRKTKASDLIVEEIWAAIVNGELTPGERLPPERELVEQFGVSKVTLREALQTLEANGYVERKRGATGGTVIKELSPTKGIALILEYLDLQRTTIDELIDARTLIEPMIAFRAAEKIEPERAHQLEVLMKKHQAEYETTGKSKFGWHFEEYVSKLTDNNVLIVLQSLLVDAVRAIEQRIIDSDTVAVAEKDSLLKQYYKETYEEHSEIATAIIAGDPDAAKAAMAKHRENWASIFRRMHEAAFGS